MVLSRMIPEKVAYGGKKHSALQSALHEDDDTSHQVKHFSPVQENYDFYLHQVVLNILV